MNFEDFRSYCLSKSGTTEDFPHGNTAVWFKVMGKMFAMTFINDFKFEGQMAAPFTFVNLKCDPEKALELREKFPAVRPGWHQNKKFWNSVFMNGSLSDEAFRSMIDHSYEQVVAGLTKKLKEELANL